MFQKLFSVPQGEGDAAIRRYLSTIRERAGQSQVTTLPSKNARQKGVGTAASGGGKDGGKGAHAKKQGVLEIGWTAEEGEGCHALLGGAAAIAPPAVSDDTLLSLKRPNKGPLLKDRRL
jgi:hypothetical protein